MLGKWQVCSNLRVTVLSEAGPAGGWCTVLYIVRYLSPRVTQSSIPLAPHTVCSVLDELLNLLCLNVPI